MNRLVAILAVLAITVLAACGGGNSDSASDSAARQPAGSDTPAATGSDPGISGAMAEARAHYGTECARCHGARGQGDGPMGRALNPGPRDYSDPSWHESVTDEYLRKVILEGGKAHGLSAMMPASPDLADRPEVLDALVQHIRSFAR